MSAHVKNDKMHGKPRIKGGLPCILSFFHNELSYDIKITLKSHFWHKKVKIFSLCSCYEHHFIRLPNSVNH